MKKVIFVLFCGIFTAFSTWAKTCTPADAKAADMAVDSLDTWMAVNQNRINYGHCDQGDIAEGNSEAIVHLLVDHWDSLADLKALLPKNPALKAYVFRHIDSTLDTKDLDTIQSQATHSCPSALSALCDEIRRVALRAANE
ncbi:hypothetical protein [Kosakonia oryzendophytica]|uniref:hypothetical protein n=1 Tax=Kosakonia TaxID=1330547 RepID=UPI00077735BA|nr:hypothetical protein [Kosakonia oryzendophytica]AMO49064.1 exported protein [Enterobacter sp. FY-07]WBT56456.1 hypothetical protein O9K67_14800 [Kosakonia oryzendophytica]